jgi:hypothetical protein
MTGVLILALELTRCGSVSIIVEIEIVRRTNQAAQLWSLPKARETPIYTHSVARRELEHYRRTSYAPKRSRHRDLRNWILGYGKGSRKRLDATVVTE